LLSLNEVVGEQHHDKLEYLENKEPLVLFGCLCYEFYPFNLSLIKYLLHEKHKRPCKNTSRRNGLLGVFVDIVVDMVEVDVKPFFEWVPEVGGRREVLTIKSRGEMLNFWASIIKISPTNELVEFA
jgi:hypothetical protein